MKKIVFLLYSSFLSACLFGQDYNVSLIPDSLKLNADVVKRDEEIHVSIKSMDKVIIKRKYALTILNSNGDAHARYYNYYSSLEGLSDISGILLDASGKKIRSVRRNDIVDMSVADGMSLMLDDRIKVHNFHHKQYPYTVVYEDEQQLKGSYFLPQWSPVRDIRYAVESSKFIVETPKGYTLRHKESNYLGKMNRVENGEVVSYQWELKNLKPVISEIFQPSFNHFLPQVTIGPKEFYFGGYYGNMSTWLELGKFQLALNQGRDEVPDEVKIEILSLVEGINSPEEKVKKVYEYLQRNTRYIGIQLGIGGWQPFNARYVATNKFGDCKALSNYMVSLLKVVGIKAYYVLIKSGDIDFGLDESFPSPYFNHVVVCVPIKNDSIWLECTSKTASAGYMGTFTGDRKALLINNDGGHVVRTPVYTSNDNLQIRNVKGVVDEEGNLQINATTFFSGIQQELAHDLIHHVTAEQRENYLNSNISLPSFKVNKCEYIERKDRIPAIQENLSITATNYASVTGKRLFVRPNLFNKMVTNFPNAERKYPIEFKTSYTYIDTVVIAIPEGYIPETLPKDVSIKTTFSDYSIAFSVKKNEIIMIRKHIRQKTVIPNNEYAIVKDFFDKVIKADNSRIILLKNDSTAH